MVGIRKFVVVLVVCFVAGFVSLNQWQADVLIAVLYAFVAGNAVEHLVRGGYVEKTMGTLRGLRGSTPDGPTTEQDGKQGGS